MKDDTLYVIHINECIERISRYIENLDKSAFLESSLIQDAVLRNLQILTESTQRLSTEFKDRHPDIPWHKIAGMRNILVHDYLGIDIDSVWVIATRDLASLADVVRIKK